MADLKFYVWRNVLRDYTAGMAVAVADSVSEARGILAAESEPYWGNDLAQEPEEYDLSEPLFWVSCNPALASRRIPCTDG